jgi:hypothetical protein
VRLTGAGEQKFPRVGEVLWGEWNLTFTLSASEDRQPSRLPGFGRLSTSLV